MAIMAITTRSSTRVKARFGGRLEHLPGNCSVHAEFVRTDRCITPQNNAPQGI